jgi:uncharacterized membrane protein
LALALYAGLASWLWAPCLRHERRFARHHFAQALALGWLLIAVLLLYAAAYAFEPRLEAFARTMALLWAVAWLASIATALAGSVIEMPVIAALAQSRLVLASSFLLCNPLTIAALFAVGIALQAPRLVEHELKPAAVYLLYDPAENAPPWVYDLGLYRITRAARRRWGAENVVAAPLSRESLEMALRHGRFVFLAAHGNEGVIATPTLDFGPDDARSIGAGGRLRLVYVAGCRAGVRAADWQAALAPAEVIAFAYDSKVYQHALWLWLKGPRKIAALP